ncbi:MAG: hypothetical protein ABI906_08600 [Pseudomonadota bacterium]
MDAALIIIDSDAELARAGGLVLASSPRANLAISLGSKPKRA